LQKQYVALERHYGLERNSGRTSAPVKHTALRANRSCAVDTRCVWTDTGQKLTFNETRDAELSTIDAFSGSEYFSKSRKSGYCYDVLTVSLNDWLREHGAPPQIDYISVDTEGSEFHILKAFEFSKYHISIMSVEHNYSSTRESVLKLMTSTGIVRVFESLSMWDDWYVNRNLPIASATMSG
jgi:FkbM family methyltransferase